MGVTVTVFVPTFGVSSTGVHSVSMRLFVCAAVVFPNLINPLVFSAHAIAKAARVSKAVGRNGKGWPNEAQNLCILVARRLR